MSAQLGEAVAGILAAYWLEENLYCGLSCKEIRTRLQVGYGINTTLRSVRSALSQMEAQGLVSSRDIQGDRWAYPKRALLEPRDPLAHTDIGIYTRQLRLGGGQIDLRFFNRQVLDRYLQDPRYVVDEFGAGGSLWMKSDFDLAADTAEEDKVFIQHYLIAYKDDDTQAVAVPLSYLGLLSKQHQYHWAAAEISSPLALDQDSYRQAFQGEWTDRVSPFDAFLQELREINCLCDMIGWPHLFHETFEGQKVPGFGWMTKPTSRALEEFIHTLDKLLSENMNRDFFAARGIPLTEEIKRKDGTLEVRDKGTIILLKNFLKRYVRLREPDTVDQLIAAFREIRSRRRKPAHEVTSNRYDRELLEEQREIVRRSYGAIRDLRLIFIVHPAASDYEPPDWLQTGRMV